MTPEMREPERTRLETVFLEALERPTAERDAYLERECGEEPEMLAAAREMLEGERRTRGVSAWDGPVWEAAGLRFGPYRVTGRIGSGGMGVVYEAVRDDEFRKRVAIKTLSPALLTEYAVRKLREERQILAELEHPNIARLLDGGTTAEGLPYVVMEHIEGEPLTGFARSRRLGTEARLRLFLDVCGAVECAHANLIVHADLKPANILVTAEGAPKLLDFGLARLVGGDTTVVGALTPDYASPEQFAGGPVTTASDVYSLGVVLFELLAGAVPARGARKTTGAGEELDNIVGMALEAEPAQRYRSVAALGDDVRRYLDHYPVLARGNSWFYRARKYARRNRVAMAAASLAIVSVATGAVLNARESRRTRRQFEQTRALAHALLFDTYDAIAELPGATAARKRVASLANEYLDRLTAEPHADTALRKELAISYRRLGEIRGAPYAANLGDTHGALENYRRAEALLEGCLRERPGDASIALELARTENATGRILVREGDPYSAAGEQAKALGLARALSRRDPRNPDVAGVLGDTEIYLGQAFYIQATQNGKLDAAAQAMRHYQAAEAIFARLLAARPNDPEAEYRLGLAAESVGYGHWMLEELGDSGEHRQSALAAHRRELELMTAAAGRSPANARYERGIVDARGNVAGSLWRAGEHEEALAAGLREIDIAKSRSAADPANREAQFELAHDNDSYAMWMLAERRPEWATWERRAIDGYARLLPGDPKNQELAECLFAARSRLADWLAAAGQDRAARAEYEAAQRVVNALPSPDAARRAAERQERIIGLRRK